MFIRRFDTPPEAATQRASLRLLTKNRWLSRPGGPYRSQEKNSLLPTVSGLGTFAYGKHSAIATKFISFVFVVGEEREGFEPQLELLISLLEIQ